MTDAARNLGKSLVLEYQGLLHPYHAQSLRRVEQESGPVDAAAMLVQQIVLDEAAVETEAPVLEFWRQLRGLGHPLAWLPLRLSTIESWKGLAPGQFQASVPESFQAQDAVDITTTQLTGRMEDAFFHWMRGSNGRIEAREFAPTVDASPRQLVGSCVQRALDCRSAAIDAVEPAHAFLKLSESSRGDGAYTSGRIPAYGRLQTWKLLQTALDCDADASVEQIDEAAREATWFVFKCDWFFDIAWDCGVAVVRPDRHVIVLAATDQD